MSLPTFTPYEHPDLLLSLVANCFAYQVTFVQWNNTSIRSWYQKKTYLRIAHMASLNKVYLICLCGLFVHSQYIFLSVFPKSQLLVEIVQHLLEKFCEVMFSQRITYMADGRRWRYILNCAVLNIFGANLIAVLKIFVAICS